MIVCLNWSTQTCIVGMEKASAAAGWATRHQEKKRSRSNQGVDANVDTFQGRFIRLALTNRYRSIVYKMYVHTHTVRN